MNASRRRRSRSPETDRARSALLRRLEHLSEVPMVVLSLAWVALLIVQLVGTWSPLLGGLQLAIWSVFFIDFALKFILAPAKPRFLKHNILTLLALVLPALRVLRVVRAIAVLRVATGTRVFTLLGIVMRANRGINALAHTFNRRGFGYVLSLTILIAFVGAAGMLAFERSALHDYPSALWWTAMILTTMGSDFYPHDADGRILCLLLTIYGFTIFGYITATLSSLFVHIDTTDVSHTDAALGALRLEVAALRSDLRAFTEGRSEAHSALEASANKA